MNTFLHYLGLGIVSLLILVPAFIIAIFCDMVDTHNVGVGLTHQMGPERKIPCWMVWVVKIVLAAVVIALASLVCVLWSIYG